jgi:flagellar assembly factor FliW
MIHLQNTRFGELRLEDSAEIRFPRGLLGFPDETKFALIERERGLVSYLQSLKTPELALPVIDGGLLRPDYPGKAREDVAALANIDAEHLLVLVVVRADPEERRLRGNLVAPILVDAEARAGFQVVLDSGKYATDALLGQPGSESSSEATSATAEVPREGVTSSDDS